MMNTQATPPAEALPRCAWADLDGCSECDLLAETLEAIERRRAKGIRWTVDDPDRVRRSAASHVARVSLALVSPPSPRTSDGGRCRYCGKPRYTPDGALNCACGD